MKIDTEKIQRYLLEIKARHHEIKELLSQSSDAELLKDPWVLKGLKYTLVEIAEAMANILQHILAKEMGEPVTGYVETVIQAGETNILPNHLSEKINYPAASCGALKSKTYFHVVIPSRKQESSLSKFFLDSRFRGSDSDLAFFSNLLNHFAFGETVFIHPASGVVFNRGFL